MKSLIVKRSVVIDGHKTSVSVEDTFWDSLKKIAAFRHLTLSALLAAIDSERHYNNLSSSIRLFVLNFYRDQFKSTTSEAGTMPLSADASLMTAPPRGWGSDEIEEQPQARHAPRPIIY